MEQPGVGSQFGPYRLARLIGQGGFGEVYEAEDTEKGRLVALKLMTAEYSKDPLSRERLFREAAVAGRLNEPHVVPVHSYGEIDGHLYIDMRLIRGDDLATVLASEGRLDAARAVWVVRQIASALDAAHGAGMVHRDIKPANILLSSDDFACLVDFGLANAATDPKLTATGEAIGTLSYMAPERFTGIATAGNRADIYALACVLFECLIGSKPYPVNKDDQLAIMSAHVSAPIPRPSQLRPGLPTGFDEVISVGMAKNPNNRYRSAGDLARAAHRALGVSEGAHAGTARKTIRDKVTASTPDTKLADQQLTQLARLDHSRPVPAAPEAKRRRLGNASIAAALTVSIAVAIVIGLVTIRDHRHAPTAQPQQSAPTPFRHALPFSGLKTPGGVAVDAAGSVYVTDRGNRRIVKLAAGSTNPTELAFTGLVSPKGIAVGDDGSVYVTDNGDRVVKLAANSNAQTVLPYAGLKGAAGVAIGAPGSLYVADGGERSGSAAVRVVKFVATGEPAELPFTNLTDASGLAVDMAGNVYVTNSGGSYAVVRMAAGSPEQTKLPIAGFAQPTGVAVDGTGTLYVVAAKDGRVIRQAPGEGGRSVLVIDGLKDPSGVAVDSAGNVYISDAETNQVFEFPKDQM